MRPVVLIIVLRRLDDGLSLVLGCEVGGAHRDGYLCHGAFVGGGEGRLLLDHCVDRGFGALGVCCEEEPVFCRVGWELPDIGRGYPPGFALPMG